MLFYQAAAERLHAAPGVERVGVATALPLQWIGNGEAMKVPGVEKLVRVRFKRVDAGYFQALGIPVLAGRGITGRDVDGTPRIMVINEALAARLASVAGAKNPVGMTVRVSCPGYVEKALFMPEVQIAGVIRNERTSGLHAPEEIHPRIVSWLRAHSEPVTPPPA